MDRTEVMNVDPDTGARKASKKARFDLVPAEALWELAEHFGVGALKYDDHNWRKGYNWSKSYQAMMRHASQFWAGEDYDDHSSECPEDCVEHTGSKHVVAAAWHALILAVFMDENRSKDDRPTTTGMVGPDHKDRVETKDVVVEQDAFRWTYPAKNGDA